MTQKQITIVQTILLYLCAFSIPIIVLLIGFYLLEMFPFGENTLVARDIQITYINFYEWYRSCLVGDGNLFYSFSKSLGGNMYTGWASILTSPINLLVAFFSKNPADFITFMISIKFGLAGVTSLFYLRRRFKLSPIIALCLSVGYSMMLFMTTQSVNPMWMEAVILLPLVMYGIYCLVHHGRVIFFTVTLLLSIVMNYYNGYMVCLFAILFYLFESYLAAPNASRVRLRFLVFPGRFSLALTLAISTSFVILLPVALGLFAGKGAVPSGFITFATRFDLFDLPRSLFLGVFEQRYLPQLYSGTLILIALLWFFLNEKIKRREKISSFVFIIIMTLSVWLVMGDRVWLGFRDGNDFYCRFTFLITALFLYLAARSFETMNEGSGNKRLIISASIVALIALIVFLDNHFSQMRYFFAVFAMCVLLPAVITLLAKQNQPIIRNLLSVLLVVAVCFEATLSWIHVQSFRLSEDYRVTVDEYYHSYSRLGEYYEDGRTFIAALEDFDENTAGAYRVEKTSSFVSPFFKVTQNESMAFGYSGVALYDSAYDSRVQQILYHLGYTPDAEGRLSYSEAMILADSLLGVKYTVSSKRPQGYQLSEMTDIWEGRRLYENPYVLPLGYRSSQSILEEIKYNGNPFTYQNDFLSALSGTKEEFLVPIESPVSFVNETGISWKFNAPKDVMLYGYINTNDEFYYLDLYIDETYLYMYSSLFSQGIFPIEFSDNNGSYTITLKGDVLESNMNMQLYVAYLNLPVFEAAIEKLRAHPFEIDVFEDGYVHGTYYAEQDELLFTTIPYDPGWTIRVNGSIVTPQVAQDAFIALELTKGENVIEMSYISPGFISGAIVSLISIVLFALFAWRVYSPYRGTSKTRLRFDVPQ